MQIKGEAIRESLANRRPLSRPLAPQMLQIRWSADARRSLRPTAQLAVQAHSASFVAGWEKCSGAPPTPWGGGAARWGWSRGVRGRAAPRAPLWPPVWALIGGFWPVDGREHLRPRRRQPIVPSAESSNHFIAQVLLRLLVFTPSLLHLTHPPPCIPPSLHPPPSILAALIARVVSLPGSSKFSIC